MVTRADYVVCCISDQFSDPLCHIILRQCGVYGPQIKKKISERKLKLKPDKLVKFGCSKTPALVYSQAL